MKKIFSFSLSILFSVCNFAQGTTILSQQNGSVKNSFVSGVTTAPAASAILEGRSTTKGFLAPRMTTTQRNAIASPATGLMIYNTTTGAFNYYNGSSWNPISSTISSGSGTTANGTSVDLGGALTTNAFIIGNGNDLTITSDHGQTIGFVLPGDSSAVALTNGNVSIAVFDTSISLDIYDRFWVKDSAITTKYLLDIHTGIPSVSVGAGAGTGASVSVSNSTDISGEVTLNTGTLPAAASVGLTLTYAHEYTRASHVVIFPANALTALLSGTSMVFITNAADNFKITSGAVALTASSTYKWSYIVMQ